jgi:hypothetical protein
VEQGWWLDRALAGETGCRDDLASVAAYLADPQVQERSSVAT